MYEDRVRVFNKGILVAVQSEDNKTIDLLDGIPAELIPISLFGPTAYRSKSVPFYSYFVPIWLTRRMLPSNMIDLQERLEENNSGSREELALRWKYRMANDDIEVEFPA